MLFIKNSLYFCCRNTFPFSTKLSRYVFTIPKQKDSAEADTKDTSEAGKAKKKRKAHHPGASQNVLKRTKTADCKPEVCPQCGSTDLVDVVDKCTEQFIELKQEPLMG